MVEILNVCACVSLALALIGLGVFIKVAFWQ